jgi:hypothetical protein
MAFSPPQTIERPERERKSRTNEAQHHNLSISTLFREKAKPIFIEFLCAADDEGPSHAPQQQQCEEKVYKLSKRKPFFSITINVSLASCNSILLSCSFASYMSARAW